MSDNADVIRPRRGFIRSMMVMGGLLLALMAGWALNFPPVLIVFWTLGEVVIPAWETIDPTAPRLPILPNDLHRLKDAEARGKALRATVDKFYVSLPESRKSWLREILAPPYIGAAGVDISKIVQHYIPVGTSFEEAEAVLQAAGMKIMLPRRVLSRRTSRRAGEPSLNDAIKMELAQQTSEPPGYMRIHVWMLPQNSGEYDDSSPVGKVTAALIKQNGAPIPPVSFPLDASSASAVIDTTIKVVRQKSYQFKLAFSPADSPEVGKLVGDAFTSEANLDRGRYRYDFGVVVPLHVVVTNDRQEVVYERTIDTKGSNGASYRGISRFVGGVELGPGLYRIRVNTTKEIPELTNINIDFSVTYDARY